MSDQTVLFIGFIVKEKAKYLSDNDSNIDYEIKGVRLYSILKKQVFDESIEYFIKNIDGIHHGMKLFHCPVELFESVNKALGYLLERYRELHYSAKIGFPVFKGAEKCLDNIIRLVILDDEHKKAFNTRGSRGYYSPKLWKEFVLWYRYPIKVYENPINFERLVDYRVGYKLVR